MIGEEAVVLDGALTIEMVASLAIIIFGFVDATNGGGLFV
jgi:hypothetical protein